MQKPRLAKTIFLLITLVAVVFVAIHFFAKRETPATSISNDQVTNSSSGDLTQSVAPSTRRPPKAPTESASETTGESKLPREKVEAYLSRHNRNASSLLAAFHASDDTNYLNEAATNFPNDPQVQWTILNRNVLPEERRKWLDAFKTSSPDNSLANYLSANDYFKTGQKEAALNELVTANGKSQFKDFATEAQLDSEELNVDAGMSARLSFAAGMSSAAGDLLPELSNMKALTREVIDLQKQYANANDPDSAANMIRIGLSLAGRFNQGEGSKFFISQLVGNAMESIVLDALDQNTSSELLGGKTPTQRLAELKQRKADFRTLQQGLQTTMLMNVPEAEWLNYAQRQKIYGEVEAMRWVQQQHSGATPNTGN